MKVCVLISVKFYAVKIYNKERQRFEEDITGILLFKKISYINAKLKSNAGDWSYAYNYLLALERLNNQYSKNGGHFCVALREMLATVKLMNCSNYWDKLKNFDVVMADELKRKDIYANDLHLLSHYYEITGVKSDNYVGEGMGVRNMNNDKEGASTDS